ncbi:MAG: type II toxin-antitoxin system VapB family antitoxin [Pseudonocardia sp.]|nr:type II toxin-antitoxin system VapB family antitoxin [Pseudonocardia sp.]
MSLNIKNPEAHELARQLAELTGESLTDTVTIALRERLARERNTEERIRERTEAILAIGREAARHMSPEWRAMDVDEYLYDENGLPK